MFDKKTNGLLESIAARDPRARERETVLRPGTCLHETGDRIEYVYFPRSCLISLAVVMKDGRTAGATLVGSEGAIGLSRIFGLPQAGTRAEVLIGGAAVRMPVDHIQALLQELPGLMSALLVYQQSLIRQINYLAACNSLHTLDQRLSCWLLVAHQRGNGQMIPITQEALAQVLGAHRASIIRSLHDLCSRGAITEPRRGLIAVADDVALARVACECSAVLVTG
jgi:CRP-like cAMP-binding protein